MRRTVLLLCVLIIGSIGQAKAEWGDSFWLVKGSWMWLDKNDDPDSLSTLGLTYGLGLTQRFSFEIDYDRSLSGGAYKQDDPAEEGEYKLWLASANVAYRHLMFAGIYLKAKLGYMYGNETRTSDAADGDKDDDIYGVSGSLGLGYLAGPLLGSSTTFELNYNWHKQDINSVMLGLNLTF